MRIAYYSPLPPERSGIADYSALLLPALERRLEVVVVGRKRRRRPRGVDLHVYHVGNNAPAHGWIVDELRRTPGVVVLHDFVLHHLVAGMTLGRGDRAGYLDAMQQEAGPVGRMLAHGVVDGLLPPLWEIRPHEFPLAGTVLSHADGLLVHSKYVADQARAAGYTAPIWHVPHAAWDPPSIAPDESLAGKGLVVGCVGNINPSKRIPQLLAAFAALRREHADAVLVLAGSISRGVDLHGEVTRHSLEDAVVLLPALSEERLWSVLAGCDVCVNLRWPTMGETSGIVIRALGLGVPMVVSDVGWFSELPDSVAVKVPVDEWEVETLARTLALLAERPDLRESMARAARDYVREEHDLERAADLYVAAFEEAAGRNSVRDTVLREVAAASHDVGIDFTSPELDTVGARLRELEV